MHLKYYEVFLKNQNKIISFKELEQKIIRDNLFLINNIILCPECKTANLIYAKGQKLSYLKTYPKCSHKEGCTQEADFISVTKIEKKLNDSDFIQYQLFPELRRLFNKINDNSTANNIDNDINFKESVFDKQINKSNQQANTKKFNFKVKLLHNLNKNFYENCQNQYFCFYDKIILEKISDNSHYTTLNMKTKTSIEKLNMSNKVYNHLIKRKKLSIKNKYIISFFGKVEINKSNNIKYYQIKLKHSNNILIEKI